MRFNFKKISALATGALLAGMTMGFAAAANYPAPFVQGGAADVAIVYGTGSGVSYLDAIGAGNIQTDLQKYMSTTSGGTSASVSGEAYALFTSSSKVYLNDSMNAVKSILTDTELPTVLVDGSFEGNVNRDYTQTIKIGPNPRVVYGKYPTSDDDPTVAISLGTTTANYIYNATVTFDGAVNFTSSDSEGESITLFGRTYTVSSETTNTSLYLFETSETISLSIGGADPSSTTVEVNGETYTVELISASDTAADIRVTDSSGNAQTKTITEDSSKRVQGIDIGIDLADEDTATNRLLAQITVGANKVKLTDGSEVRVGSDEDIIDGTNVALTGNGWESATAFTIQVSAEDTDVDAIVQGGEFVDPVFGSFKIDFPGLKNDDNRETISVAPSGNDKAKLTMTTHTGDEGSVEWYYNVSTNAKLADSSGDVINVVELAQINKSEYAVVGNEEEGYLLELRTVSNSSDGYSDDRVEFSDVFSDDTYTATITDEGTGSLTVGGKTYTVTYVDDRTVAGDEYVRLNYPDTTADGYIVAYPTIQTSKGANLALYEPVTLNLTSVDGSGSNALSSLYLPDGDGYTYVTFTYGGNATNFSVWNVTPADGEGTLQYLNTSSTTSEVGFSIGQLNYNLSYSASNLSVLRVEDVSGASIINPGIVVFEGQDDSSSQVYNALIVKMEVSAASSSDGVGVEDVEMTWGSDAYWDEIQMESNDDLYKSMDYWGTIVTTDRSQSSQYSADIEYPEEQVYAEIYVAEDSATITPGSSGSGTATPLGEVLVKDSEVSSVSSKNLIVIGGSCINSAAATLVGGSYCGADWTDNTNVGSGEFLIKSYSGSKIAPNKIALLVAGYNVDDTSNAVKYLKNQKPDTSKTYKGTSSTSAELVTTTTDTE